MPGIAQKDALFVTIVLQVADTVIAGKARLGNHLVHNPIEGLLGVEIVVSFE